MSSSTKIENAPFSQRTAINLGRISRYRLPAGHSYVVSTTLTNSRADVIGKALTAIAPEVNACIVIDTGARDLTIGLARRAVLVAGRCIVPRTFKWTGSFADARNYALLCAYEDGADWAITADTDETLHVPGLQEFLRKCKADVVMVRDKAGTYCQPRIIRVGTNRKWRDPVHEYLDPQGPTVDAPADWYFVEQERPQENTTAKYQGYLATLRALPENARRMYYTGDTLAILGWTDAAIAAFHRCGSLPGWSEQAGWAYMRAAMLQFGDGDFEAALQSCYSGMVRCPIIAELYVLAGAIQASVNEDYQAAHGFATVAIQMRKEPREGFCWPALRDQGADRLLARAASQIQAPK